MLVYEPRIPGASRLVRAGLAVLLLAAAGCPGSEPTEDTGSEPTGDTGSDPTDATGSDPTSDTGSDPTGGTDSGGSDTETGGPVQVPWQDVPCGETTCVGSDVCVQRPMSCDYSPCRTGGQAQWVVYPPECQTFPDHCDPIDPESCLWEEYCPIAAFFEFVDGHLECEPEPGDCYCID